jgi:hypothetical protein
LCIDLAYKADGQIHTVKHYSDLAGTTTVT